MCCAMRCQRRRDAVRLGHGLIFVVKNVARNHNQIGLHVVDRRDCLLDISRVGAVSQMQVGQQRDGHILACALQRHVVIGHIQPFRLCHAVKTDRAHQYKRDAASHAPHLLHLLEIFTRTRRITTNANSTAKTASTRYSIQPNQ